jgi:hypothetical protein
MVVVRVVEMVADEVVDVVAVRNAVVAAPVAMGVPGGVVSAAMVGRAGRRVLGVDFQHVLVDVVAVRMV